MKERKETFREWFRLDNAAVIFSLISSPRIPALFRLSVTLKKPVNVSLLQTALNKTIIRFPYFRVNLRPGLFWYYLRKLKTFPRVEADSKYPCKELYVRKRGTFPFRIRAFQNRIAIEFHHSITDGTGGIIFLKTLVEEYLKLCGVKAHKVEDVFDISEEPSFEEYEDSYKKFYNNDLPSIKLPPKAFRLPYKLEKPGVYHLTTGIIPVKEFIKKAKEYNVTVTEFLVAIYLDSLQEIQFNFLKNKTKRKLKPIRVSIPINLRRIYPSKTMRNFSLFVTPGIDPRLGKFTFDEIIKEVYHFMRTELNDKYISQSIRQNVRAELNPILRIMPLFIKKMFGRLIYMGYGEKRYSGSLSNLGVVKLPPEVEEHVEDFQFLPGTNPERKVSCGVISFKNKLYINFGNVSNSKELEKIFFRKIVKMGIPVKIESN
ncbi:MAG: hypothetical protein ACTSWZ_06330 [Candidatus Heimdallarchaeaceae archaeon]